MPEPNREPAGQREMQFAESCSQHQRVDYRGMSREIRDRKLITAAVKFELLRILAQHQ